MAGAKICAVTGCGNRVYGLGFCFNHYRRFKRHGDPLGGHTTPGLYTVCTVDGCDEPHFAKSFCRNHHHRWKKHGDPLAGPTGSGEPLRWLQEHATWTGEDCLIWPYATRDGDYGRLKVGDKQEYAHRLMCVLAHGSPPLATHEAAHSCGRGHEGCVNPLHLRWDTRAGNAADRMLHGTENIGERNGQAKLTEEQVREIRACAHRETQQRTADRYGIARQTVSEIRRGRRWAHLD